MPSLVFAALAAATTLAHPDPAILKAAFGNTIVSTYPDGRQAQLWLRPNGSYACEGRRGDRSAGRWKLKGTRICLKQSKPFAFPLSYCAPVPPGGVGTVWSGKAVTGEPIRIKLVRGAERAHHTARRARPWPTQEVRPKVDHMRRPV